MELDKAKILTFTVIKSNHFDTTGARIYSSCLICGVLPIYCVETHSPPSNFRTEGVELIYTIWIHLNNESSKAVSLQQSFIFNGHILQGVDGTREKSLP